MSVWLDKIDQLIGLVEALQGSCANIDSHMYSFEMKLTDIVNNTGRIP